MVASTTGGFMFGDMNRAMVKRVVDNGTGLLRLDQRYADYLQIGYLGYVRCDVQANDLRSLVVVKANST